MSDKIKWEYYKYKRYCARIKHRITGSYFKYYAGKKVLTIEQGNKKIYEMLSRGEPCAVARFGSVEMSVLAYREALKLGKHEKNNDNNLCILAGFFPNKIDLIDKFTFDMINSLHMIDLLGIWYNRAEEYIFDKYMNYTVPTGIIAIEPYMFKNPWSACLKRKTVLVVHPFADSIKKQYMIHEKLFDNKNILPDFELKVIKAVQTQAFTVDERFSDWFEALDFMKRQIESIEFDVAIIGCGAYGMPLAIHAKKIGKQAIHMGGATQIMFGIKGNRWDKNPQISALYNEYWVRPNKREGLEQQNLVENGCYW